MGGFMDILDTSQKTNYQKMLDGDLYTGVDEELFALNAAAQRRTAEFMALPESDTAGRMEKLREMVGKMGKMVLVMPPFFFDYGIHILLGEQVFINTGSIFLDSAWITIGDRTMVGPRVQFLTAGHPTIPEHRLVDTPDAAFLPFRPVIFARPITIGSDCWIGAGSIILPGVTIGDGTTIGAGSVVSRSIPDRVVAAGNPARVMRRADE